ncbi:hypothetical protein RND81_02G022300 [Saponaria officinalis]
MPSEETSTGLDSSLAPPSEGGLPPLVERRLRPPHDQNLKCPRCDSTYTKFCYYNNYNLSQPRYFCKTCRRYWTKGGSLRNIPVGGGCRKNNKKSSSRKSNTDQPHLSISQAGAGAGAGADAGAGVGAGLDLASSNPNDFHLSFPRVKFPPHLVNFIGAQMSIGGVNERHEFGVIGGMIGDHNVGDYNGGYNGLFSTFGGINICSSSTNSPYGLSSNHDNSNYDGNLGINLMDQRLLLPFDENAINNGNSNRYEDVVDLNHGDPKPLSSLECQDQGCNNFGVTKDLLYGYNVNDTTRSSWNGVMGGFQSSTTNSLV